LHVLATATVDTVSKSSSETGYNITLTLTQSPKNTSTSCELHEENTFHPNGGVV